LTVAAILVDIYKALFDHFGPQQWWPGESPLEILVGAILTQNTNWANVSRAIGNLKTDNLLTFSALNNLPETVLADKIRPSGYFNLKAKRLKNLLALIKEEEPAENIEVFFRRETSTLREKLLAVKGIGPETADSILLYAGEKPVFVVDTYTYRMLTRHGLIGTETDYGEMQQLFMDTLEPDVKLYNEYHALIVRLGKEFCKKRNPRCIACPLRRFEPLLID